MSYTRSSALRWFEVLLENARKKLKVSQKRWIITRVLEKLVNLGDLVFPKLIYLAERLATIIGKLQMTMIESMILASLWSGTVLLITVVLITLLILAK